MSVQPINHKNAAWLSIKGKPCGTYFASSCLEGVLLPDMEKSPFPVISFLLCTYAVYARPGKIVRINATTRAVIVVFNTVVINTYL